MSYDASLYAQLHRGTKGDVEFYRRAVHGAANVLELGCGFGRIFTELARAGHQVHGLDINPDMVELSRIARDSLPAAHASLITLEVGDMRNFTLSEHFDRVIIPYNGLYCMLSQQAIVDCLRCAGDHLRDNGKVVFDAYAIDNFHALADPDDFNADDDDDEPIETITWQGKDYNVFETCTWDKAAQRLRVTYRHVPQASGDEHIASLDHRYVLTSQLADICKLAGLEIEHLYQDFEGTELSGNAEHIACIASRRNR